MAANLVSTKPDDTDWPVCDLVRFIQVPANWAKIFAARAQKGGWEGWLQVELGIHYPQLRDYEGYVVSRELHVYANPGEKCDLLMEPARAKDKAHSQVFCIELKTESLLQTKTLKSRLMEDIEKSIHGVSRREFDGKKEYKAGAKCVCIGLTTKDTDVQNWQQPRNGAVKMYTIPGLANNGRMHVIWWEDHFNLA